MIFPHQSLANEDGVLAIGGDLSVERLLLAYSNGIFPWYNEEDPIIWWCPYPRYVLYPNEIKVSKSMRPIFNQKRFHYTIDTVFEDVMKACAEDRKGQEGTWITEDMLQAYIELHHKGFAHSIEVWQDEQLVGGLYGIAIGKVFYGESMFARVSNASKAGFIKLVQYLKTQGYQLIDCQQGTNHLISLGARAIPIDDFLKVLEENRSNPTRVGSWSTIDLNV